MRIIVLARYGELIFLMIPVIITFVPFILYCTFHSYTQGIATMFNMSKRVLKMSKRGGKVETKVTQVRTLFALASRC